MERTVQLTTGLMFELSGELPTVPRAEVLAAMEADGILHVGDDIVEDDGILIVPVMCEDPEVAGRRLASRLAMSHAVDIHFGSSGPDPREVLELCGKKAPNFVDDKGEHSFKVRVRSVGEHGKDVDMNSIAAEMGSILSKGRKVDLECPGMEYRLIISGRWHLGQVISAVDRSGYEERKAQYRPFFSPVTLHPRQARALVNLSRLPRGGSFLDPFSGTGGIMMEAGRMTRDLIGTDVDGRMVKGCAENLEHFGVTGAKLMEVDVRDVPRMLEGMELDAMATDPPYARASGTFGDDTWELYSALFDAANALLRRGGHIAVSLPSQGLGELPLGGLVPVEVHEVRVHRSLTRWFHVLRHGTLD